jgi:hypothetical protein
VTTTAQPFTTDGEWTSPPVELASTDRWVVVTVGRWNGDEHVTIHAEMSFDGGDTWIEVASAGPAGLANLVNRVGEPIDFDLHSVRALRLCQCGESYWPGDPANGTYMNHSTYKGASWEEVIAVGVGNLHEIDPGAFHNPEDQDAGVVTLVRAVLEMTGLVSSQLTITGS